MYLSSINLLLNLKCFKFTLNISIKLKINLSFYGVFHAIIHDYCSECNLAQSCKLCRLLFISLSDEHHILECVTSFFSHRCSGKLLFPILCMINTSVFCS